MDHTTVHTRSRFDGTTLAFFGVLQWPTALAILGGLSTLLDLVTLVLVVASFIVWLRSSASSSWVLSPNSAAVLATLGSFLGMRDASFLAFLLVVMTIWMVTVVRAILTKRQMSARVGLLMTMLVACLAVVEAVGIPQWSSGEPKGKDIRKGQFTIRGSDAYRSLLPNSHASHRIEDGEGRVVFDVEYDVDERGSRRVPGRPEVGPQWMLFGGSHTFGNGLSNDETLAANLQRANPDVRVLNFGVPWCGTADAYFHMKRYIESETPPEWSIYNFIDDHIYRTAAPDAFVAEHGHKQRPCFDLRPELKYIGNAEKRIANSGKLNQLHFNLLQRSSIYFAAAGGRSWEPTEREADIVAALVTEMRDMARDKGNGEFLFVVIPQNETGGPWPQHVERITRQLEKNGVRVLNCQQAMLQLWKEGGENSAEYFFPIDRHPTAKYARFVAEQINETIQHANESRTSPTSEGG